ncbi:MAG: ATP-binding protein [Candidatus Omnitrophica bacterium]|nr:ATP-binding protein [Candidatus Omnitrophota bacterium]
MITKKKNKGIHKQAKLLNTILENIPLLIMLINEDLTVQQINKFPSSLLQKKPVKVIGIPTGEVLNCLNALSDPNGCGFSKLCRKCKLRKTILETFKTKKDHNNKESEFTLLNAGKKNSFYILFSTTFINFLTRPMVLLSLQDITKRKKAETILKQSKKEIEDLVSFKSKELLETQKVLDKSKRLSELGTLASTVAHELRNPLCVIQTASYNIRRKCRTNDLTKHLDNIDIKVTESNEIIENILSYAKIKSPRLQVINLNSLIEESLIFAENRFSGNAISITKKIESTKDLSISADKLQLGEIFSNLIENAFQATSGKKQPKLTITTARTNDSRFIATFKDNGCGIDCKNIEQIFEPFFSLKSKGTGLGLTICRELINLHNGDISISSIKNKGTIVTVSLPISPGRLS